MFLYKNICVVNFLKFIYAVLIIEKLLSSVYCVVFIRLYFNISTGTVGLWGLLSNNKFLGFDVPMKREMTPHSLFGSRYDGWCIP